MLDGTGPAAASRRMARAPTPVHPIAAMRR
jgi:hypothetical protein